MARAGRARSLTSGASASSRKALAAARAAGGDDLAAADGGHARSESRGGACARFWKVDRSASRYCSGLSGASTEFLDALFKCSGFTLRRWPSAIGEKRRRREAEIASGLIEAASTKSQRDGEVNPYLPGAGGKNSTVAILIAPGYCQGSRERLNSASVAALCRRNSARARSSAG